jgi:hypothetical protein
VELGKERKNAATETSRADRQILVVWLVATIDSSDEQIEADCSYPPKR